MFKDKNAPVQRQWTKCFTHWRNYLVPEEQRSGLDPFSSLIYLGFLFLPVLWFGFQAIWLAPTLLSVVLFLPVYFYAYRQRGRARLAPALIIAGLSYALTPVNASANTYIIYACALFPFAFATRPRLGLLSAFGILLAYTIESWWLHHNIIVISVTWVVASATYGGSYMYDAFHRKQVALKLSHDEVRRLAALAERERIGRDLHDLLGHTLSLITLKSELANKLMDRDPQSARQEMGEVERVAREALAQVRRAVTGIRAAGLVAELASARLMLESAGIEFSYELADISLPLNVESCLALAVREAVTNIQRHTQASHAHVKLTAGNTGVMLEIYDDGRGSDIVPGNGLTGMRERLAAVGATLKIDSAPGQGTALFIQIPLIGAEPQTIAHSLL